MKDCNECEFFGGYGHDDGTPNCEYEGGYEFCPFNCECGKNEKGVF